MSVFPLLRSCRRESAGGLSVADALWRGSDGRFVSARVTQQEHDCLSRKPFAAEVNAMIDRIVTRSLSM